MLCFCGRMLAFVRSQFAPAYPVFMGKPAEGWSIRYFGLVMGPAEAEDGAIEEANDAVNSEGSSAPVVGASKPEQ